MKVLADFHHEDLYYSLHLLFEKRLGWELYRQIGTDWYNEGYWMVYDHPDTAGQYLGTHLTEEWAQIQERNPGMRKMLNETAYEKETGIYLIPDYPRGVVYKGITLDKFKNTQFDIVISSMPSHINRFNKLVSEYQTSAKHIFQAGNNWNVGSFSVNNILSSSTRTSPNKSQNVVYYHQEFDLNTFKHLPCEQPRSVFNMMHYMRGPGLANFNAYKSKMPDWKWFAHGSQNADGPVLTEKIPEAFVEHGFLWHFKPEGDGFGYNPFHALASGRPIITHKSFFKGMTLDPLLVDGKTCINLDGRSQSDVVKKLNEAAGNHIEWSNNTHAHFKAIVDYDAEFERIKAFLSNLK